MSEIKKKKISELTEGTTLDGFYTIGAKMIGGLWESIRVNLGFVQTAADGATAAATKATNAATTATTAAGNANTATTNANNAASSANTAANSANTAATAANNAASAATTATNNANTAATNANNAAAIAKKLPYIQGGTWWVYNVSSSKYVDSGVSATGKSPKIIDNIWWYYDDATEQYVASGVSASDFVLTKEGIETVYNGKITSHYHAEDMQTLEAAPTEDTLTYTVGEETRNYVLGDMVRVYDSTGEEYDVYILADLSEDSKATWEKVLFKKPETALISITSNLYDDAFLIGQVIHLKYGTEDIEYTWDGNTISVELEMGTTYTVEFPTITGYDAPTPVTNTASNGGKRIVSYSYDCHIVSTITIDQSITDPDAMITGDINGEMIQWIRNNSHRVVGKKTADGEITYCRLDDSNSNYYYDGTTTADLTGGDGDVFMKMPAFSYKCEAAEEGNTDVWKISFTKRLKDSYGWKVWEGDIELIGVYLGHASDDRTKMYSYSGFASDSHSGVNKRNQEQLPNRGSGYKMLQWRVHCLMAALFFAKYGTTNSQAVCGYGCSVAARETVTGLTNSLGMTDTTPEKEDTTPVNFWGLEGWWGSGGEVMNGHSFNDGIRVEDDTYTDPTNPENHMRSFGWTVNTSSLEGYVKKFIFGEYMDLYNSDESFTDLGTATTGFCDNQSQFYYYYKYLVRGGAPSTTNSEAGVTFFINGRCAVWHDWASWYQENKENGPIGRYARLCFRGTCIEETDIEAYKAITPVS